MFAELKIDFFSVSESVPNQGMSVLERQLDEFAAEDYDVGMASQIEPRIENARAYPSSKRLCLYPTPVGFLSRELVRLQPLCIFSPAKPGECPYASPIVMVTKSTEHFRCVCTKGN